MIIFRRSLDKKDLKKILASMLKFSSVTPTLKSDNSSVISNDKHILIQFLISRLLETI